MVFRIAAERLPALVEAAEKPERDAQIALGKLLVEQAQFLNAQASVGVTPARGCPRPVGLRVKKVPALRSHAR